MLIGANLVNGFHPITFGHILMTSGAVLKLKYAIVRNSGDNSWRLVRLRDMLCNWLHQSCA